jgi:hypothetical protein
MTKEEYLKGFLLAGMYVSNVRSNPQPSTFGRSVERERQRLLSLPELARLQQPTIAGQLSWGELWQDSLSNTVTLFHHAYSNWQAEDDDWTPKRDRQVGLFGSLNDPLMRVSQRAQWHDLRESVFNRLENIYVFRSVAYVKSFLEKNVFLTPLLFEANSKIRQYFGMSSTIALEVSLDPENGRHQQLWARIQTEREPADAMPLLTKFDDEWWLEASIYSHNLLNIKLEYV